MDRILYGAPPFPGSARFDVEKVFSPNAWREGKTAATIWFVVRAEALLQEVGPLLSDDQRQALQIRIGDLKTGTTSLATFVTPEEFLRAFG